MPVAQPFGEFDPLVGFSGLGVLGGGDVRRVQLGEGAENAFYALIFDSGAVLDVELVGLEER